MKAIKQNGRYCLEEKQSLSRVKQHSEKGFVMMSAFRGDDEKKNKENHKKLLADLKSAKLGYFVVDGVYKYDDGTIGKELSVFVAWNKEKYSNFTDMLRVMKKLGKKYNQESILIKYPHDSDKEGAAVLYYPVEHKEEIIGKKVGLDKISFAYSKLRKASHKARSFVIEGTEEPQNHIDAMGFNKRGQLF